MKSLAGPLLLIAMLSIVSAPAVSAPLFGADDLQRNGAVSRHVWTPDFAAGKVAGVRISAGVALGLRDSLQSNLGRSVTPALTFHTSETSSLSLLPAGNRGAMLVLQTTP